MNASETRAQLDVVDCLRTGSAATALAYDAVTAQCAVWSLQPVKSAVCVQPSHSSELTLIAEVVDRC